ncbi:GNAT family N-acetyltransferase [Streptomyces sp. NBC_01537]|uniref:GNAT family N-acetyltransferase n=1 Tax=Streptomyces sp. NBC_01537 TaxID=2903896 RepID=UPI003864A5D3
MLTQPALAGTRPVTEADWHLIEAFHRNCSPANLVRRWGRTHINRRGLSRLLAQGDCWITLDADGIPVALASIGPVSREPGVVDLGLQVADAHQRRGIGTALARHAADHARARGAHTLTAYTEASNEPMLRLLHRLGPSRHTRDGAQVDVRIPLDSPDPRCRTGSVTPTPRSPVLHVLHLFCGLGEEGADGS